MTMKVHIGAEMACDQETVDDNTVNGSVYCVVSVSCIVSILTQEHNLT